MTFFSPECLLDFFRSKTMTDSSMLCVKDLLTLCPLEENSNDTQSRLSECATEETIDNFPELALDDEEYMCYVAADNVRHLEPVSTNDDTKSSTRRLTELDRLARNGWKRDSTSTVLGKRNLYTYNGPNGVVETSLKRVMQQISLSIIVDKVEMSELEGMTEGM